MSKRLLAVLLAGILSCAVVLSACTTAPPATPDASDTSGANEAAAPATKPFETVKGTIEVPVDPQRIVSDYYLGELLAVGVKPIIASPYSLSNPFLASYVSGIEPLNITSSETALEMIATAEPDLIITLSEADYDNFSKIAPTVLVPYDTYSPEELFYYLANLVGKKDAAVEYMTDFLASADDVKSEMQTIVGSRIVSFVEVWPNEIYVMGSHFARGGSILFDLWGLKAPAKVQESMVDGNTQYEVVALEVLPQYAGDIIFYSVLADADSAFVEDSAVWQELPAVKNGLVKQYEQVAFMHSDPITLTGQLDFYTEYFRSLE
jgi:iron complex transport system substrate-binding protein